nr:uncharacterized protein LOC117277799 [Nicotiana tomentosiformis]
MSTDSCRRYPREAGSSRPGSRDLTDATVAPVQPEMPWLLRFESRFINLLRGLTPVLRVGDGYYVLATPQGRGYMGHPVHSALPAASGSPATIRPRDPYYALSVSSVSPVRGAFYGQSSRSGPIQSQQSRPPRAYFKYGDTRHVGDEAETPNELQIVEKFGESDASNDSTTNNSESQSSSKKRKMVKERSVAWHHFTKFTDAEGVKKAKCKYCSEEYVVDTKNSGTSNLLSHIPKCPSNPNKAETSQTTLAFQQKGQTDLKKHKKCGGVDSKTDLDKYLGEDVEEDHEKFNILGWCKLNSPRFPTLAEMTRDVLVIPISSVPQNQPLAPEDAYLIYLGVH